VLDLKIFVVTRRLKSVLGFDVVVLIGVGDFDILQ
jgi:hypothetical protein